MEEAQRQAALVVRRVLDGATLPAALAAVAPADARRAARRPAAAARWCRSSPTARCGTGARSTRSPRKLATKPFSDPALGALVAVALYQLDHTRAPPFAVVDHAVNAAAVIARPAAKRLVNALLRRYLREREALNRGRARPIRSARWSHPQWWIERVRAEYPDALGSDPRAPATSGRRSRCASTRGRPRATRSSRRARRPASARRPAGEAGVIVDPPRPVTELPGYREGWFSVQDLGAQLAAPLLRVEPGMRVLDACAAPGGKTTHLAELADVEVVALDSDAARLDARPRESRPPAARRGAACASWRAMPARPQAWWDGRAVRPHPGRRAVHGVGRRAPPSRRQVAAAARTTSRASRGSRRASSTRSGPASRPAASCCTRPARSFATKTRRRSRRFSPGTPMRCANPSPFPTASSTTGANSCLRSRAQRTIRTDFSTRCCARVDPARGGRAVRGDARRPHRPTRLFPRATPAPLPPRRLPACRPTLN